MKASELNDHAFHVVIQTVVMLVKTPINSHHVTHSGSELVHLVVSVTKLLIDFRERHHNAWGITHLPCRTASSDSSNTRITDSSSCVNSANLNCSSFASLYFTLPV